MTALQFKRADLVEEVKALKDIAMPFLDPRSRLRLDRVMGQLKSAPDRCELTWELEEDDPLFTEPSFGAYEQEGRHGLHIVTGAMTFVWHLALDNGVARLVGNASTRITLTDGLHDSADPRHQLGIWRMEIGAHDSPGPCFHVQVIGDDAGPPFPPSLPVPRFPTLVPTPMAALEFLLGELFQDEWKRAVGSGGHSMVWRTSQRRRWAALLDWQRSQIEDGVPSPWAALKRFPPVDTFVRD